ncbi:hypothetical protein RZS08_36435, partial [Arthrospira platensis SPKY1]|nr:hypothetical protein [Arthrospira platensis SPKY1]
RGQAQPGSGIFAAANRALLQSWYWPDDAWLWIHPAQKTARQLLKQGNWDALLSVSLPFSAHWIARSLKAQYPTLTWLADIGDPLALQTDHPLNNPILYQKRNRRAERSVLEKADVATLTNENLRTKYLELFPDLHTPLQVIPPLASFLRDPDSA